MIVFLDTNVLMDFYDNRPDFFRPAAQIMECTDNGEFEIAASTISFVNIFYLLRKKYNTEKLYDKLENLSQKCHVSPVDEKVIKESLRLRRKDFEDTVQYESAKAVNADVIVTRNKKDFENLGANVMTPIEFLNDFFAKKLNKK